MVYDLEDFDIGFMTMGFKIKEMYFYRYKLSMN
jgi:hypothetical protein